MRKKNYTVFYPKQLSPLFPFCKCLSHSLHIQVPLVDPKISSRAELSKPGSTAGPCTTSGHGS